MALVAAIVYALPNMPAVANSPLGKLLPQSRINLGLDLKGGMNLTLGVDVEKALQNTLDGLPARQYNGGTAPPGQGINPAQAPSGCGRPPGSDTAQDGPGRRFW